MTNTLRHFSPQTANWFVRRLLLGFFLVSCVAVSACNPPALPELDDPPCLTNEIAPKPNATIPRLNVSFRLDFSKLLDPETVNEDTIYLVRDEMELGFLSNLESTSAVTETRAVRLVPLALTLSEVKVGSQTASRLIVKPKVPLRGDSVYQLVITRKVRDKLTDLGGNQLTGWRPLNRCADKKTGVWVGSLTDYKTGFSIVLKYKTEPEPPRPGTPRIVEIMANPPSGKTEYIEILNTHKSESLDLCGLFLSDGSSAREITAIKGGSCRKVASGKRVVITEPDYDTRGNPYKIPSGVLILTTKGSSTTLLSGGISSGEPVQLLQGQDLLEQISPSTVAGGVWPSSKSYEKCDPNGPSDANNWAESGDASGGTPGRPNSAKCK